MVVRINAYDKVVYLLFQQTIYNNDNNSIVDVLLDSFHALGCPFLPHLKNIYIQDYGM